VAGAWKLISKQRQRVDVSYDMTMVTSLGEGTWMDDETFRNTCIREKEERGSIHPFYSTWAQGFMLRKNAGKRMLGKYLGDNMYQGDGEKRKHPSTFIQQMMSSRRHAEKGSRKAYAGKVFERQTNSMEVKETFGDGCGRNYADSQSANQNRQEQSEE